MNINKNNFVSFGFRYINNELPSGTLYDSIEKRMPELKAIGGDTADLTIEYPCTVIGTGIKFITVNLEKLVLTVTKAPKGIKLFRSGRPKVLPEKRTISTNGDTVSNIIKTVTEAYTMLTGKEKGKNIKVTSLNNLNG